MSLSEKKVWKEIIEDMTAWMRFRLYNTAVVIYIFSAFRYQDQCVPNDCGKHETLSFMHEFFMGHLL